MYNPPVFRQADPQLLREAIRSARLGSLITVAGSIPLVSHVPMLLDDAPGPHGTLRCHLARANPQVATLDGPALATFVLDDAYVHPGWYGTKGENGRVVPTWNYVAVHVRGDARTLDRAQTLATVEALTDRHERERDKPWHVADAPEDYVRMMLDAIVGVELVVTSIEGKWKLGQDEPERDAHGVMEALERSASERERSVGARMRSTRA